MHNSGCLGLVHWDYLEGWNGEGVGRRVQDGEQWKQMSDFIFLGSKITADGECSHEIKRRLLLGRKVMTKLDNILKNRDY